MNDNKLVASDYLCARKKFKYLKYIPKPIHIDQKIYDLVDDDEFCKLDGRIPILMVTQHGIFPAKAQYTDKPEIDYEKLDGLENRTIGFVRRPYLSDNEIKGIIFIYVSSDLLEYIRLNSANYNLNLWKTLS